MPKNKSSKQKLIKKLDKVFSEYIRLSKGINGYCSCYTCGKKQHWKSIQNGHFISRSCMLLRWSEENCFPQCVACNVFRSGNYIEYTRKLIDEYGIEKVDELRSMKTRSKNWKTYEIEEMIETYKNIVENLKENIKI